MVSRYVLIKTYNPAYNYWLRAHLREKKILGDREFSWKEAEGIIMDMEARGFHDDFFRKYFSAWTSHPEYAPGYFNLLRMIVPIDRDAGEPDVAVIAQLDDEAKKRGERILFAVEDAAKNFYEFYDKFLTKPLTRDLQRGAEGKKLADYFEYEEFTRVPDPSVHGPDKVEKASQEIARELLAWLRAITADKIMDDMKSTLDQHYDKAVAGASPEHGYHHKSEYVEISANKSGGADKAATTILMPVRAHRVVREGYQGVHYPMYYVRVKS